MAEIESSADATHLQDHPDWVYLLQEFDAIYRMGSSGGSTIIRSHRKRVRDRLSNEVKSNPLIIKKPPVNLPVTAHLPRALDLGERGVMQGITRALRKVLGDLVWEYGYQKLPRSLVKKYAYCEVLGPNGPVKADNLIIGFVLFAPSTTYPQHNHPEIEESYISISGSWSENNSAVFSPGSLIFNTPGAKHRITTGDIDPCLLAYAWTGSRERLMGPDMNFSRK
ncbi:dimethylsulfonioproprionate lyase family protein [Pararhizobium sp. IMCC21322]|uniref:dimethylsulfonioproprionate lyase family protein n=1 Tax=Pararhizobium sp. IMCC21322 TaxID=3067903 RepID=UPI0027403CB3|nr:dimethylsulfonioproprionate lyase family protein [Pararhizobium sp. IMCC21322]